MHDIQEDLNIKLKVCDDEYALMICEVIIDNSVGFI